MKKRILVYIGVMGPQDGLDYLLRALHHLVHKLNRRDVFCVLIGPGDSVIDLKKMAIDLRLDGFVRFTGYIPKGDLLRYLSTADICLDPNPSNPLNDHSTWIKVMEYMAFGKPTISFDLTETRFTAGKAAIYVKPNDEKAFANAIAELMDDPDQRAKMGRFGRERIENELSWNRVSGNLLAGYEQLLGQTVIN